MTKELTQDLSALKTAAKAIRSATYVAWSLALGNNPHPKKIHDRMQIQLPGDLVVETKTLNDDNHLDAVGTFLRITEEPMEFSSGAIASYEELNGPYRAHLTEPYTYIRTLDGREVRWRNTVFLTVPQGL